MYTLLVGMTDRGNSPDVAAVVITAAPIPGIIECASPINSGPQHFVLDAAVAALDRWVRTGKPPRRAPRLEISPGPPVTIARDQHGNAVGGIRTPWVDVPIAALSGEGQSGGSFCGIFGTTVPFDAAKLAMLYPSHAAYLKAYKRATRRAVRAGFLRKADATLMLEWAAGSDIGG
jgi:hypothetical protein